MQDADIPAKFSIAWAQNTPSGNITNPIPDTPQPIGHASFEEGYGTINSVPVASGGIPPWGSDTNGIFYMITAAMRWLQAGGLYPYDGTFSAAVGGYPRGAMVPSATKAGRWYISTADDNTNNPDTGGADWLIWGAHINSIVSGVGTSTVTVPDYCNSVWLELWGGGGGGSGGNTPNPGSSGAAGGYAGGWYTVSPGETLTCVVGAGGAAAASGATAGSGGTTSVTSSVSGLLASATGGVGGGAGPGSGGSGTSSAGGLVITGAPGTDLDGVTPSANGGSAPRGGLGGTQNAGGVSLGPTTPGGGGAANTSQTVGTNGAPGLIFFSYRVGP